MLSRNPIDNKNDNDIERINEKKFETANQQESIAAHHRGFTNAKNKR